MEQVVSQMLYLIRYFHRYFICLPRIKESATIEGGWERSAILSCPLSREEVLSLVCAELSVLPLKFPVARGWVASLYRAEIYLISHLQQETCKGLCAGANERLICTSERRSQLAGTLTFPGSRERSCTWKSWRMCHSRHTILYVPLFMKC